MDSLLSIERPGAHAGLGGLWRLGRAMGRGKHVAAVLGPPSLRAALLALLGNIPLRVGYASDGRGALLKVALPVRPRGESHHARELTDLGRALLQRLGRPVDDADLPRDPGLPGVASVEAFPAGAGAFRLVLAPGATYGLAKNWPRERVAELAGLALAEGAEVVAMGDAQARHFVSELAGLLGVAPRDQVDGQGGLVNMAGRTDFAGGRCPAQEFLGLRGQRQRVDASVCRPGSAHGGSVRLQQSRLDRSPGIPHRHRGGPGISLPALLPQDLQPGHLLPGHHKRPTGVGPAPGLAGQWCRWPSRGGSTMSIWLQPADTADRTPQLAPSGPFPGPGRGGHRR